MLFQGYTLFVPGGWDSLNLFVVSLFFPSFSFPSSDLAIAFFLDAYSFFSYAAMFIFLLAGVSWKLIKRTKMVQPLDADFESDIDVITAYEAEVAAEEMGKPKSRSDKIWDVSLDRRRVRRK